MKKIIYNFSINEGGYPSTGISRDYWMLDELGGLPRDKLKRAVSEMEQVKNGERESCSFGYISAGVDVTREKTVIEYDYMQKELEVPFDDIYNLMKDWLAYIEEWEKETGQVKK